MIYGTLSIFASYTVSKIYDKKIYDKTLTNEEYFRCESKWN